ncbi:hypothetical protein INT48_002251 [Thamnidium elegans]|uniref:Uncharacterized protein n=1 Tax=Thamnidium elegans TaxID=101142 RepID=A0A8H7VUN1_9FUNG|nr:hypothetical protein INT48_002251 [Thamnidium elegans]
MQANESSEEDIKEVIRNRVYMFCNQMKSAVSRKEMPEVGLLDNQSRRKLNSFISGCPKKYSFKKNSFYLDVMASPENHFESFFKLAELSEAEEIKLFSCFSLRTTFNPCYMTLDRQIVHCRILKSKSLPKAGCLSEIWGNAADLKKRRLSTKDFRRLFSSMEL